MEGHHHIASLRRKLQHLCALIIGHLRSIRHFSAIAIIALCIFCFIFFNLRDNTNLSLPVYPVSIPVQNIDNFHDRDWDGRALQQVRDLRTFHNDSGAASTKNVKTRKFPNVIIIGARKAGTRALITYLDMHPQVVSAKNEIHFFDNEKNYAQGMKWYREQMPLSAPGQLTVEKTPQYLVSSVTPARVHRMNSSILLLLTLRHPLNRAVSDYLQILALRDSLGLVSKQFPAVAINNHTGKVNNHYKPVWISTYEIHMSRWLELFPLKQIHFIDGDRLITDPLAELRSVETFLGLNHFYNSNNVYFNATRGFYCTRWHVKGIIKNSCLGETKGRKHPPLEQWVRDKLNQFFYKHNEVLFKMIGRRFDWT